MGILKTLLLAGIFLCLTTTAEAVDALRLREQEIKAGLLYNFLKYTEWPESSFAQVTDFSVCLFGGDPFGGSLKPMQGRTVNRRVITVREIRDISEVDSCHLLFVNGAEKTRWPELRKALAGKNVLTVSDIAAFTAAGGMIELGYEGSRINAVLNASAVTGAGLRIEDRMLRLVTVAREVP